MCDRKLLDSLEQRYEKTRSQQDERWVHPVWWKRWTESWQMKFHPRVKQEKYRNERFKGRNIFAACSDPNSVLLTCLYGEKPISPLAPSSYPRWKKTLHSSFNPPNCLHLLRQLESKRKLPTSPSSLISLCCLPSLCANINYKWNLGVGWNLCFEKK